MTDVAQIDTSRARALLEQGGATFIDIRDPEAYQAGHVPGALWVHDGNARLFTAQADKSKPVVVYCYKGQSSLGAAEHFQREGFKDVVSLAGGFNAWEAESAPAEAGPATAAEPPASFKVTEAGAKKMREYLGQEPSGTAVRVVLENGAFGLSLDEPHPGDGTFTLQELPFVVDRVLLPALEGLSIDYTESVQRSGFVLEGGKAPAAPGKESLKEDIQKRIAEHKVMIFMKGTAQAPQCGFSARSVEVLRKTGKPFGDKNVLEDPQYRYALSEVSSWPTIPQVFINGEFVGGCDILMELDASGELQRMVDAAYAEANA